MRIKPGELAPAIAAEDAHGRPFDLAALRGRRVMLSFYRYASCPICNLRMHELILAHQRLAERGLDLVAVFQSPEATIAEYVGQQEAPFPILADPSMNLYRRYGVEAAWWGFMSWRILGRALAAMRRGFLPGRIDGPFHRTPADFLIDADGKIALAHYGRDIDDHLPLPLIERWLAAN